MSFQSLSQINLKKLIQIFCNTIRVIIIINPENIAKSLKLPIRDTVGEEKIPNDKNSGPKISLRIWNSCKTKALAPRAVNKRVIDDLESVKANETVIIRAVTRKNPAV